MSIFLKQLKPAVSYESICWWQVLTARYFALQLQLIQENVVAGDEHFIDETDKLPDRK